MLILIDIPEEEYKNVLAGNFSAPAFYKAVREHSIPMPTAEGSKLLFESDVLTAIIYSGLFDKVSCKDVMNMIKSIPGITVREEDSNADCD